MNAVITANNRSCVFMFPVTCSSYQSTRARTHTHKTKGFDGRYMEELWMLGMALCCSKEVLATLKESSIWELKRRWSDVTRQKIYVWRNIEVQSCHHCCCGRAISIKYHECVSVFCLSYPACKSHLFWGKLWSLACPTLPYFSALFHKRNDCPAAAAGGRVLNIKCVFCFLYNFCRKHFKDNSARYYRKCKSVFMESTHYSCQVLMKLELPRQIFEKLKYGVSSKSVWWEPKFFMLTDGRTHMTKLVVAFRNFSNAPLNRAKL